MKKIIIIDSNKGNRILISGLSKLFVKRAGVIEIFDGEKAISIIKNGCLTEESICFINLTLLKIEGKEVSQVMKLVNPNIRQVALTCNGETLDDLGLGNFNSIIRLGTFSTVDLIKNEIKLAFCS
ncbi:MAG: hypothetical protein WCI91_04000 [Candidatus Nomurabacteria bacterium]